MPDLEKLLIADALRDYQWFYKLNRPSPGILPSNYAFVTRYGQPGTSLLEESAQSLVKQGKLVKTDCGRYQLSIRMLKEFNCYHQPGLFEQLEMFTYDT